MYCKVAIWSRFGNRESESWGFSNSEEIRFDRSTASPLGPCSAFFQGGGGEPGGVVSPSAHRTVASFVGLCLELGHLKIPSGTKSCHYFRASADL